MELSADSCHAICTCSAPARSNPELKAALERIKKGTSIKSQKPSDDDGVLSYWCVLVAKAAPTALDVLGMDRLPTGLWSRRDCELVAAEVNKRMKKDTGMDGPAGEGDAWMYVVDQTRTSGRVRVRAGCFHMVVNMRVRH